MDKFKSEKLIAKIMEISPGEAKAIWDKSSDRLKENYDGSDQRAKIKLYKKYMESGDWGLFFNYDTKTEQRSFVQQPLIFNKNGAVFEGKHRIIALSQVEKEIKVPFFCVLGFRNREWSGKGISFCDWENRNK